MSICHPLREPRFSGPFDEASSVLSNSGGSDRSPTCNGFHRVPFRAGWAWHMPNATVAERAASKLIPFGTHRFPDGPRALRVHFPKWRRDENTIPKPVGSMRLATAASTLLVDSP